MVSTCMRTNNPPFVVLQVEVGAPPITLLGSPAARHTVARHEKYTLSPQDSSGLSCPKCCCSNTRPCHAPDVWEAKYLLQWGLPSMQEHF